jgi:hypothetical protein
LAVVRCSLAGVWTVSMSISSRLKDFGKVWVGRPRLLLRLPGSRMRKKSHIRES